jgi:hypothetical protein
MPASKITPRLASTLRDADDESLLDVIVEMSGESPEPPELPVSRTERIAALRSDFSRRAEPVEALIRTLGGHVVDKAWLNHTLRARLPRKSVVRLEETGDVAAIDAPEPISREG